MKLDIAVLSGDGIGPEVTDQAIKTLNAVAETFEHKFAFQDALVGAIAIDETGDPLPKETLDLCKNTDAVLFGSIGAPKYDNDPSAPNLRGIITSPSECTYSCLEHEYKA